MITIAPSRPIATENIVAAVATIILVKIELRNQSYERTCLYQRSDNSGGGKIVYSVEVSDTANVITIGAARKTNQNPTEIVRKARPNMEIALPVSKVARGKANGAPVKLSLLDA